MIYIDYYSFYLKLFYFSKNILESRTFSKNLNSFKLLKIIIEDIKVTTSDTRYGNRNILSLL